MKKIKELMSLENRVALITGGAGHIGSAIAQTLCEQGAHCVLNDVNEEGCREAVGRITRTDNYSVDYIVADISNETKARQLVDETIRRHGHLDILVHSAALVGTSTLRGWAVPFEKQSYEAWEAALRLNLSSGFVLCQEAAPAISKTGHGSIIFISSIYGVVGPTLELYEGTKMGNPAAYGASKAGLIQLTKYLATVLAPDIRVNAISPGGVFRGQDKSFTRKYCDRTPLKRMANEEDLIGAAAYLASDLSAYVTGHNLIVDGGWTAW